VNSVQVHRGTLVECVTSHDVAVGFGGSTYVPKAIGHGQLLLSLSGDKSEVEIEAMLESVGSLDAFFPFPPEYPVMVEIRELMFGTTTSTVLFSGRVTGVRADGKRLRAAVQTRLDVLGRELPRFRLQKVCNHRFGDAATCKVNLEALRADVVVDNQSGLTIEVHGDGSEGRAANYFAYGHIVAQWGNGIRRRTVLASADIGSRCRLTLNAPLNFDGPAGTVLKLYPGCDFATVVVQGLGSLREFRGASEDRRKSDAESHPSAKPEWWR